MSASPKILIIRLSSIGDILHALPAFADLRASFPNSEIHWVVAQKHRFLVSALKGIDAVHVLGGRGLPHLIRTLRRERYDFCIDFQGLLKTAALCLASGARSRIGFPVGLAREWPAHWFYNRWLPPPPRQALHVVELNRMLAALTGATRSEQQADFCVPDSDRREVESILRKAGLADFVVINPGGGWPTKRWSLRKYGQLAERIAGELGLGVGITTGPGEDAYYDEILESCNKFRPCHWPLPFLQLIPLFQRARLVVSGDTGPLHLACMLGTPVVGIFGPTSPVRNGPWRAQDEVVVHPMACSYCYGRNCKVNTECMNISVDEVMQAVVRGLARTGVCADEHP